MNPRLKQLSTVDNAGMSPAARSFIALDSGGVPDYTITSTDLDLIGTFAVRNSGNTFDTCRISDSINAIQVVSNWAIEWSNATTSLSTIDLSVERDSAPGALKISDPSLSAAAGISLYTAAGTSPVWLTNGGATGRLYVGSTQGAANGELRLQDIIGTTAASLTIRPGSSQTLIFRDGVGSSAIEIDTSGFVHITGTALSLDDNIRIYMGTGNDAQFEFDTMQTNDSLMLWLDPSGSGQAFIVADFDVNINQNLGLPVFSDPTLILTSATAWVGDTTEWASLSCATGGVFEIATGDTGHYVTITTGATEAARFSSSTTEFRQVNLPNTGSYTWRSAGYTGGSPDTALRRASAGVINVDGSGSGATGTLAATGFVIVDRSSDPSDPSNGSCVIWQSDGTATGVDGDVLLKITNSVGSTRTVVLSDAGTGGGGTGTGAVERFDVSGTGPWNLGSDDYGKTFTDGIAGGTDGYVEFDLPSAVQSAGPFTFLIESGAGIRIYVGTGDMIQVGNLTSTVTGGDSVESSVVGNVITIRAINNSTWFATSGIGTWTIN